MKKLIINIVVLFGMVTSSWANSYYHTLSISGAERTLTYGHSDWSAAVLSWNVDDETYPDYWTYDYVWSAGNKGPRHLDMEGSSTFTSNDNMLLESYRATIVEFDGPGTFKQKYGTIFGLKWDLGSGIMSVHRTFISTQKPMWGNGYAKGGLPGATYAKNPTFEIVTSDSTGRGNGWALVPNTVVPIPSALWLLGPAFIGIVGLRRKLNNKTHGKQNSVR